MNVLRGLIFEVSTRPTWVYPPYGRANVVLLYIPMVTDGPLFIGGSFRHFFVRPILAM